MLGFQVQKEQDEDMSVKVLYEEIMKDAPFRSHTFMFDETIDWKSLELQEEDGIIKKFPEIKTEGERYEKIKEEILNGTYEPVPISRDIDYPEVFYVDNGFHRIVIAKELNLETIKVKAKYGKFKLDKNISLKDLASLLEMLSKLFAEKNSVNEILDFLKEVLDKKPEFGDMYLIGYGGKDESN